MKRQILSIAIVLMALAPNIEANNIDYVLQQIKLNNTQLKALNAEIEAQTADIKSSNNLSDPTIDGAYLFGVGSTGRAPPGPHRGQHWRQMGAWSLARI